MEEPFKKKIEINNENRLLRRRGKEWKFGTYKREGGWITLIEILLLKEKKYTTGKRDFIVWGRNG